MLRMVPLSARQSSFPLLASVMVHVILLFNFCLLSDAVDHNKENCHPRAIVDLSYTTKTALGFLTEHGLFLPANKVWFSEGIRSGCLCDMIICLESCESTENNNDVRIRSELDKGRLNPYYNDVRIRSEPDKGRLNPEVPLSSTVRGSCGNYAEQLRYIPPSRLIQVPHKEKKLDHIRNSGPLKSMIDRGSRGTHAGARGNIPRSCIRPHSAWGLVQVPHKENKLDHMRNSPPIKSMIDALKEPLLRHKIHCKTPVTFNSKVCFPENDGIVIAVDDRTHPLRTLKYFGGLVAVPFLVATILIYSILPELRNTHGATLRCYLCCLTLAHGTLSINRLSEPDYSAGTMCLFLGFVIYCSSIASFLWLNVICFDLWSKFGDVDFLRGIAIKSDRKRMMWYSIYAWGITFAMTAICVGMEFIPGIPESVISPGFKSRACWFNTKEAAALYYFGPIGLTIACNVCFFIATAITLVRYKYRSQNALNSGDSNRVGPGAQSWFKLYAKLFVLMGISWSTETMSWLWEGPKNLWYYTDTVNALHGLLIFVIFVCKKDIWMSLKERGKKLNS